MAKKQSSKKKKSFLQQWGWWIIGGAAMVVIFPIIAAAVVSVSNPKIKPVQEENPIWTEFKAEVEFAAADLSIPLAARQAASDLNQAILTGNLPVSTECPNVIVSVRFAAIHGEVDGLIMGSEPADIIIAGSIVTLVENFYISSENWYFVPGGTKWSEFWHEFTHLKQDCIRAQSLLQYGYNPQELASAFMLQREQVEVVEEAYVYAVQMYWYRRGLLPTHPGLIQLAQQTKEFWMTPLREDNGLPRVEDDVRWELWLQFIAAYLSE